MSTPRRRHSIAAALALTLLAAVGTAMAAAAPSYAGDSDGYRYWNYAHLQGGEFVAAQTGPADHVPADGDVEGWRFGTSTVSQAIWPRADLAEVSFDTVCSGSEAGADQKRVAVLLDYGIDRGNGAGDGAVTPEPRAECAVVPGDADGRAVLDAVADVGADGGLVCGLDGYPATGCGDQVADVEVPTDEPTVGFALPAGSDSAATDEDLPAQSAIGWPIVVGVLVLVALAAATIIVPVLRQRRLSPPAPRE